MADAIHELIATEAAMTDSAGLGIHSRRA
jgi:hypothetical protein